MTTMKINGQAAEFAQIGDLLVGKTPVTRGQYYGDAGIDKAGDWVTKLTRGEVLAWCQEHGVRLLTDDEWTDACMAGIIGKLVKPVDVWEDVSGGRRLLRGGSWILDLHYRRGVARSWYLPGGRGGDVGFRVCLSSPERGLA